MNDRPLYIFDLDGTVACCKHRRHFVERPRPEQDWKGFYAACIDDSPIWPVISVLEALRRDHAEIWIFSGRSDEVRWQTVNWLERYSLFRRSELEGPMLTMRRAGDTTPDDELKRSWYEGMLDEDKERLVGVFDDRDRVVAMWRSLGIACFQVAPGAF